MAISQTPHAVAEQIGEEYVESDTLPAENSAEVEQIYNQMADKIGQMFKQIPVPVRFQEADPYDNYADMAQTVGKEQMLRIYNQHTDHPYFSHAEQLAFRAVHDWHGHLAADVDFSPEGEYKKYLHLKDRFTPEENRVLFAEVVGQVGAVHYLPDGFASDRYEQRAFKAPGKWQGMMYGAVQE